MKRNSFSKPLLLIAVGALLTGGCVSHRAKHGTPGQPASAATKDGEVLVSEPPPPLIVESVTITPNPGFVWVGGAYMWDGQWIWEPGHWATPPHAGAVWVMPRYEVRNGRRIWTRGYWR